MLTATIIADRYELEEELARGGMGTVWIARDKKLGRAVAVKVMAQELAQLSEPLQRFEREAMAVAQLRSAHIVQVYDYGVQEGLPFMVMELLVGENLGQRLRRVGRLTVRESAAVLKQMCKGLKAAHSSGLIHRDMKPSNVFLAQRDDDEVVKLLDFGVVKALDPLANVGSSEATATGILLGTPQYMSPEQARAIKDIDHRSDLWAVSVIAFRMLTGDNPFRGESVGDVVLKICSDELPKISDHAKHLPPSLDAFFDKAFARSPRDRFQSAAEMSQAFSTICEAHLVAAAPNVPPVGTTTAVLEAADASSESLAIPPPMPSSPGGDPQSSPSNGAQGSSQIVRSAMGGPPPGLSSGVVAIPELGGPYESTPVSTTVGGTQLASIFPKYRKNLAGQPLAVVIGVAMAVLFSVLVAIVWVGSSSTPTAEETTDETSAPAQAPPVEEDDDDDDLDEGSNSVVADIEPPDGVDAGTGDGDLDEGLGKGPPAGSGKSPLRRPPKSGKTPKDGKKPDWGL
ncbi:MAG: serine/threonine protein kinase [Deltaproteobacteria bacterium]|nr:serine/threonine protein kinase [Deltaproteobacteria bacterium]